MSILDRLTDDQLKEILGLKEAEVAELRGQLNQMRENALYWRKIAANRALRISELSGDLAEIRRERE